MRRNTFLKSMAALSGSITGKPPVSLSVATPLARLTSEYSVFVLPRLLKKRSTELA